MIALSLGSFAIAFSRPSNHSFAFSSNAFLTSSSLTAADPVLELNCIPNSLVASAFVVAIFSYTGAPFPFTYIINPFAPRPFFVLALYTISPTIKDSISGLTRSGSAVLATCGYIFPFIRLTTSS